MKVKKNDKMQRTVHWITSIWSIKGTLFATFGGYIPSLFGTTLSGLTRAEDISPNAKDPNPNPHKTIPVTNPFLFG